MKKISKAYFKEYLYLTIGVFLVAFAINTFFASHNLVFGGVAGLAIVIEHILGVEISIINLLLNVPLFLFGAKYIGKTFLIRSIYSTVMLSVFLKFTVNTQLLQTDLIVSAIFGGSILGLGVGLVLSSGGSTGGSDMLALMLHKHFKLSVSCFLFLIDTSIILTGVILFGINNALYAIIVVFFISKTVNETSKYIDSIKNSTLKSMLNLSHA